jgi:hypothetical protein
MSIRRNNLPKGAREEKETVTLHPPALPSLSLTVWRQGWREYERGMGSRDDGPSYHRTREEAKRFVNECREHDKARGIVVPDVYVAPDGEPSEVTVTPGVYHEVHRLKLGAKRC